MINNLLAFWFRY